LHKIKICHYFWGCALYAKSEQCCESAVLFQLLMIV